MSANLSGKQQAALCALLSEPTLEAAARKAGIAARTLYRWLATPFFAAEYQHARRRAVGQATARLQHACGSAVDTLKEVMGDPAVSPAARTAAARTVLEFALRGIELEDLEPRLQELEHALMVIPHTSHNGKADYEYPREA